MSAFFRNRSVSASSLSLAANAVSTVFSLRGRELVLLRQDSPGPDCQGLGLRREFVEELLSQGRRMFGSQDFARQSDMPGAARIGCRRGRRIRTARLVGFVRAN